MEIESEYTITSVNVYGPNCDDPSWFSELFQQAEKYESNFMLYVGDWNIALKQEDLYNYMAHRNIKSNKVILDKIREKGLFGEFKMKMKKNSHGAQRSLQTGAPGLFFIK